MFRKSLCALALGITALGSSAAAIATLAGSSTPALAAGTTRPASSMCGTVASPPTYKHVVWILEENTSYSSVVGSSKAPFINSVIKACGVASNYHNISHNSLDNYIGLTNGYSLTQLQPYLNDCTPSSTCEVTSGGDLFEQAATKSGGWKAFDQSMGSACNRSDNGNYAVKHNPAVYYTDLNSGCNADDVVMGPPWNSPLLKSFSSESTAPAFSFVTPDVCHDMHGAINCFFNLEQTADSWLNTWVTKLTSTTVYKSGDTAIFIVWDEGAFGSKGEDCHLNTTDQSCHVPAIVIAPSVPAGTVVSTLLNHYSLLKTAEDMLGVPELGEAASATSMESAFNL